MQLAGFSMRAAAAELAERFPGARLVADYTGGTKTMMASVARLRLDRAMAPWLGTWCRFAYHEAADGLSRIRIAATSDADEARLKTTY